MMRFLTAVAFGLVALPALAQEVRQCMMAGSAGALGFWRHDAGGFDDKVFRVSLNQSTGAITAEF